MFDNFILEFGAQPLKDIDSIENSNVIGYLEKVPGAKEFLLNYSGQSFKKGLYRVHHVSEISKWTSIIESAFPKFQNKIICFSYDWLGRHFAMYFHKDGLVILMFEPGTGEVLKIPVSFTSFHEEELVKYQNESLAVSFFNSWRNHSSEPVTSDKCVGYKIPLFLGGEDTLDNLELTDLDVYWHIASQLIQKIS
ncbi:DUF1851 domain-containing protein [Paenibacillus sp. LMG 31456]|uniref:DUF1851 domain-containing protein n=1 Tax=Paenibacillus foliorum TaxID=2654974 RepID=A0A972GT57_9BACL|nr:T6SS immunity protein Tdi1 domain-containing protein [Paenibacillus foliorum]NOU95690.1 DUF1851 domain-containing protein [Paenibacillus foliorum]